jgi:pimeloyl-ACP methyl ester carboxylesterase
VERLAEANGVTICYDTLGNPSDPALLLVMGLGVQMTEWDREFIESFEREGFYVIWYDNRDCGRSSRVEAKYDLFEMANDAVGLLEILGISAAHVVGTSMGGMIAQSIAAAHPSRVLSLCSIMSRTGAPGLGDPTEEVKQSFLNGRGHSRWDYVEDQLALARLVNGSTYPLDEAALRRRTADAYDRAYSPDGRVRQVAAVVRSGDRTEGLRSIAVPTVVIHGSEDSLVSMNGGEATAAAIPNARLVILPGMGHVIPRELRPRIVQEVAANARRAQMSRRSENQRESDYVRHDDDNGAAARSAKSHANKEEHSA